MTQQTSVVTPERFAQGLTYEQFVGGLERNQDRFEENYDDTSISEDDAQSIKALMARPGGPAKCLALGEGWCPDVFRGLPVMAKLAEATGIELRCFPRDENKDIMAEFLHRGEHESIPTLVFYTKDHEYIAHWIERPAIANEEMPKLREITAPLREPDISPEDRKKYIQAYVDFQKGPVWAGWRDALVTEVRELLERHAAGAPS
jgi:hypothetical protein